MFTAGGPRQSWRPATRNVLLDAGLGGFSLDWSLVQPELAANNRVCAYDRAGYGWSDPGPQPRTPSHIADELHTMLVNAGVQGPYVLAGHSAAGKHVRFYATRYPQDVVGMVLVEARHESVDANRSPQALLPSTSSSGGFSGRFG
jgi:pimeloyl-ACP methyl ester carboxylesterase